MPADTQYPEELGGHPVLTQINEALDWETKYRDRIDEIDRRYSKTERLRAKTLSVYWSIIEVLRAATYQRTPDLAAVPRRGQVTPILRAAADVVEGAVDAVIDDKLDPEVRACRDEWLRHARGVLWCEVNPIQLVHVPNLDFLHDHRVRSWRDVTWVARRQWWSKDAVMQRWPETAHLVSYEGEREEAPIWEHWDKTTGEITFISGNGAEPLEVLTPLVQFPNFFPCAAPMLGATEPGTLVPVPDVLQYQDQLEEVDKTTARIAALTESLRLVGFYPSGDGDFSEAVKQAMRTTSNRELLIPVRNFQNLGGATLGQSIVWLPIEQAVKTIQALQEVRRALIEDIFEVTGISDIHRGAETAEERTATEVATRSAWGSQRVREKQLELARHVRDSLRLVLEAMVGMITDPQEWNALAATALPTMAEQEQAIAEMQQIAAMNQQRVAAGLPPFPEPELSADLEAVPIERAFAAIQSRRLLLDIETDSTVHAAEMQDRAERVELVGVLSQLAMGTAQAAQMHPSLAAFGVQLIRFATQGYRIGRDFQSAIDDLETALASQPGDTQQTADPSTVETAGQLNQMAVERMAAEGQIEMATGANVDGGIE